MTGKRPTGLLVLAIINFVFAGLLLLMLASLLGSKSMSWASRHPYQVLSPALTLTGILLAVTGFGFLRRHYLVGYVGGKPPQGCIAGACSR